MWIFTKLLFRFSRHYIIYIENSFIIKQSFKTLEIRALSDIKRAASPHVLYLIKHSCSCFKYYINVNCTKQKKNWQKDTPLNKGFDIDLEVAKNFTE